MLRISYHVFLNLEENLQLSLMNMQMPNLQLWKFFLVSCPTVDKSVLHQITFTAMNQRFKNSLQKWKNKLMMPIKVVKHLLKTENWLMSFITTEFVTCSRITVEKLYLEMRMHHKTKFWSQLSFLTPKKMLHVWLKKSLDHYIHAIPSRKLMKPLITWMTSKKNH